MKRKNWLRIIANLYAALFLYSAGAKLADLNAFRIRLSESPLPAEIVPLLTWLLPVAEILIVGLLLFSRFRVFGLLASLSIMIVFSGYLLFLTQYPQVSCACGGILEQIGTVWHLALNIAYIILGAFALWNVYRKQNNLINSL